jgi:hypothetical protein
METVASIMVSVASRFFVGYATTLIRDRLPVPEG